ncbi:hypothetical protein GCM10027046_30950 [Uliginosibacterium flavum]
MLRNRIAVIACFMTVMGSANAQVFKCIENGKVTFSEISCTGNSTGSEIAVRPNVIDSSESREQVLSKQVQDLQSELSQRQPPAVAVEDKANSSACKQATRSYENEAGSVRNDLELIATKRSAMFIACGQQEPASVTTKVVYQRQRQGVVPTRDLNGCDAFGCRGADLNRNNKKESSSRLRALPGRVGTPPSTQATRSGCLQAASGGSGASLCARRD